MFWATVACQREFHTFDAHLDWHFFKIEKDTAAKHCIHPVTLSLENWALDSLHSAYYGLFSMAALTAQSTPA